MKKERWWIAGSIAAAILLVLASVPAVRYWQKSDPSTVITVGNPAYAQEAADYQCDGVADNTQFQAALNALPATGGTIRIVSTGTFNFTGAVTRAINNVTIEGMGRGTYLARDGVNPLITAGGNNWVFRNLRTDAGGITMGATTDWSWENITINATYYAYRTPPASTLADEWQIPSGRGATFVVAASNADTQSIAQADYVCDGVADQVEIQAAIDALPAGGGHVVLTDGIFNFTDVVLLDSQVEVSGQMRATEVIQTDNTKQAFRVDNKTDCTVRDMAIRGNTMLGAVYFTYADRSRMENLTVIGTIAGQSLHLNQSNYCWVENNYIYHSSGGYYGIYCTNVDYVHIIGNTVRTGNTMYNPISVYYNSLNPTVANNIVLNGGHSGIAFSTGGQGGTITGNIVMNVTNATEAGIELEYKSSHSGNEAKVVSVTGNTVQNCNSGILVTNRDAPGGTNPHDIIIDSNIMDTCTTGLNIAYGTNITIGDNAYVNNGTDVTIGGTVTLTSNSGTATLLNGNVTVVVAHGLSGTPTNITITFLENPTNPIGDWWVDNIGAANFTFNGVDPGASNLDFRWTASLR